MVSEETKEKVKQETKKGIGVIADGSIILIKLILVVLKSFLKAITINFFNNIKEGSKGLFKKSEKKTEEKEGKK